MNHKHFPIGSIISADLTISNAEEVKKFYQEVAGWKAENMQMSDESGEYADYIMKDKEDNWTAGICHARGINKDLPPQWIMYINVEKVSESLSKCRELGGKVLKEQKDDQGNIVYAMIEDPAGAKVFLTKMG